MRQALLRQENASDLPKSCGGDPEDDVKLTETCGGPMVQAG